MANTKNEKESPSWEDKMAVILVLINLISGFLNFLIGNTFWGWVGIGGAVIFMIFIIFLNNL